MNTPSHAILNLAILGRRSQPQFNPTIVIGALIPDVAMFMFYGWARLIAQIPERQIWRELYYEPFWQNIFDLANSIPLALMGLGIALYYRRTAIALLFASIILHCLEDLPLHHDDAHRHFWPFSQFRFVSPVSYWDPAHYGDIAGPLEVALVLIASLYLFRLIRSRWGKGLLIGVNLLALTQYSWLFG